MPVVQLSSPEQGGSARRASKPVQESQFHVALRSHPYERLGQFQKALRSAEVALGVVDNKKAGQDTWKLLMTMGLLAQRFGDWDLARRYLRQAITTGERDDKWELLARAGVELLPVDGRSLHHATSGVAATLCTWNLSQSISQTQQKTP